VDSQITYVADQLSSLEYLNLFPNRFVPEEKVKKKEFLLYTIARIVNLKQPMQVVISTATL
jgi:hypothetical protein